MLSMTDDSLSRLAALHNNNALSHAAVILATVASWTCVYKVITLTIVTVSRVNRVTMVTVSRVYRVTIV